MRNWRVWLFGILLASILSLPYLVGALNTSQGWMYSGAAPIPGGFLVDYNSHMAKMWQGARGQWDYQLLFTHEEHPGLTGVQAFYVTLGVLAGLASLDFPLIYHLARILLTVGVVLALWELGGLFFKRTLERWTVLGFGVVAGGWSWLLLLLSPGLTVQVAPIEFWLSDAFTPLGLFYMPHFAAAILLQIIMVVTLIQWAKQPGNRTCLTVLTLSLAALSIFQPYGVVLFAPMIGLWALYQIFLSRNLSVRQVVGLAIPLSVTVGLTLYQVAALNSHPVWRGFTAQNNTLSPHPLFYVFGYLPFLIPIVFRVPSWRRDQRWVLPLLWISLVAVLVYAPLPTQRRYLLGVQTPLAILAAFGWSRGILARFIAAGYRPLATIGYLSLCAIAPLLIIVTNAGALSNPTQQTDFFYTSDERGAITWLSQNTMPNQLILTTFDGSTILSGGRVVAATGHRVYLGHWIETLNMEAKLATVTRFYNPATTDNWRRDFLADIGAEYIWYDAASRALGSWSPSQADFLEAVYASPTVTLYKVMR